MFDTKNLSGLNPTLVGIFGIGAVELIFLFLVFILLPVGNSILFYQLGKKAGYNKGKADALEKMNKNNG
jgi:hypothetical protein